MKYRISKFWDLDELSNIYKYLDVIDLYYLQLWQWGERTGSSTSVIKWFHSHFLGQSKSEHVTWPWLTSRDHEPGRRGALQILVSTGSGCQIMSKARS